MSTLPFIGPSVSGPAADLLAGVQRSLGVTPNMTVLTNFFNKAADVDVDLSPGRGVMTESEANGATRVAYILGVPLAEGVERQWPQMGEIVRGAALVAAVEGNFPELTLQVGRRLRLDDVIVVEWTCNYGDGRLYRNVSIGELEDGQAVRVTDYWGEPSVTPEWRAELTDRLTMPGDGFWPDNDHLEHH
ncbi:MAG TPA: hypothetical protein VHV57_09115 [Acidimicrobiales bacterium]|jgi:hypothetical protein|nr:hypothetical protein [Acidimicrobiales bacterium]